MLEERDPAPEMRRGVRADVPRLRLVPREHGASFMSMHALLLGLVAGLAAGGRNVPGLFLAVSFGALFLPLTAAVSVMTHARHAAAARRRAVMLAGLLAVAGSLALVHGPFVELLGLGAAGGALAGVYALVRARTGARSAASELVAIAGISLLAPLAWLLLAGATSGWPLAAVAAFLEFGGTVPYVRERVRRRRFHDLTLGERLRRGTWAIGWQTAALLAAGLAAATGVVQALVLAAFLPGSIKTVVGIARPETRPPIRKIGYVETGISTLFAVLAGIGLAIAPTA